MSSSIPPPSWTRVEEILRQVRTVAPEAREAEIAGLCGDDAALRAHVVTLLRASDTETLELIGQAEAVLGHAARGRPQATPQGTVFGPFTIVRVLGEGGMGCVYEARQDNPDRVVALKVIQPGMLSDNVLRRFQHEAQILAGLKHPGIAQVYQAGAVPGPAGPDGHSRPQPYFAMELVRGPNLTAYADKHDLSPSQRLILLARICDAIEHAHQRGVIHRDLKPGNILVEESGGDTTGVDDTTEASRLPASVASLPAQPKILDFGIARLVDRGQSGADAPAAVTMATHTGQILGTLAYMSPEQVRGDHSSIDARSDVYAIGVIGYQLLTGRAPIDVREKPITEAARLICETEAPKLGSVVPALRGDVETIIAKAMAKEPEQRYGSAGQLALDIRRYLRDEPILARPASAMYQFRKFARRNRGIVAAGSMAVMALITGTIVSTALYIRSERARTDADRQARIARAVRDYLVQDMIAATDPNRLGHDAKMADVLAVAAERTPIRFADDPEVEVEVLLSLCNSLATLGRVEEANKAALRAVAISTQLAGPDSEPAIRALGLRGFAMTAGTGEQRAAALPLFREAFGRACRTLPPSHPTRVGLCTDLVCSLQEAGHDEEALKLVREYRVLGAETIARDATLRLKLKSTELASLIAQNRQAEAIPVLREILAENEQDLAKNSGILMAANSLVNALTTQKDYAGAAAIAERLPAAASAMFAKDHPAQGYVRATAANALAKVGRFEEAEPLLIESYRVLNVANGEYDWNTERLIKVIRDFYIDWRRPDPLHTWHVRSLRVRLMVAPDGDGDKLPAVFAEMARERVRAGGDTGSESREPGAALIGEVLRRSDELAPAGHDRRARFLGNLARVLTRAGDPGDQAQALAVAEAAVASLSGCADAQTTQKVVALAMVEAAEKAGDAAKAAEWRGKVGLRSAPEP